jgi:uncharacterized membrane protein
MGYLLSLGFMIPLDREDIQIISRNSNWDKAGVEQALQEQVYNNKPAWQKFLQWLFISLGIGFATTGIVFFFAWNWASLHKFVKIGLIEALVLILTLLAVFSRLSVNFKNILLTGAAVLLGVLMAVFGQVYQTGANAYDLFLSWTLAITLWVVVANFAPLWLLYILLINTTLSLYDQQVANHWPETLLYILLLMVNSGFLLFFIWNGKQKNNHQTPSWFLTVLVLASVSVATLGMIQGIFGYRSITFFVLILLVGLLYAAGFVYGLRQKSLFYLAIIPFSMIVILSAWFLKLSGDAAASFLFIALFIIGSVSFLVKQLIDQQKKWNHETGA